MKVTKGKSTKLAYLSNPFSHNLRTISNKKEFSLRCIQAENVTPLFVFEIAINAFALVEIDWLFEEFFTLFSFVVF